MRVHWISEFFLQWVGLAISPIDWSSSEPPLEFIMCFYPFDKSCSFHSINKMVSGIEKVQHGQERKCQPWKPIIKLSACISDIDQSSQAELGTHTEMMGGICNTMTLLIFHSTNCRITSNCVRCGNMLLWINAYALQCDAIACQEHLFSQWKAKLDKNRHLESP